MSPVIVKFPDAVVFPEIVRFPDAVVLLLNVILEPSADIESKAIEPTLVILLSPKLTFPENVPPVDGIASLALNVCCASIITTSSLARATRPVIELPEVAVKSESCNRTPF